MTGRQAVAIIAAVAAGAGLLTAGTAVASPELLADMANQVKKLTKADRELEKKIDGLESKVAELQDRAERLEDSVANASADMPAMYAGAYAVNGSLLERTRATGQDIEERMDRLEARIAALEAAPVNGKQPIPKIQDGQAGTELGSAARGALGSAHDHAAILVEIFDDRFDFSIPPYQLKSPWIHFEGRDGSTIHKHATGVTVGYLFETIGIGIDEDCFVFPDGRQFCTDNAYKLVYMVNGEEATDIREYEPMEDDRILVSYGATPEQMMWQYLRLQDQIIVR
ncbi:MAG: hypothetical protein OXP12_06050 [Thaumarchaeota archaeon]|nr:hypothetical protein [Nitrososphaerota archaeon]